MPGRVPDSVMYLTGQNSLNQARDKMIRNQEQGLTGKKINRPSDDPLGTTQVMNYKSVLKKDDNVHSNLETANSFLNLTDASLGELTEVISRAKELAIQMSSTSNQTQDARESTVQEVDQLFMRAIQVGNTRNGERYIFGGYQTDRPPFDLDGNYFGDAGQIELEMDRGQKIAINVPGVGPFFGVQEISNRGQAIRENPNLDAQPTIGSELRSPASIVAENQGIDLEKEPRKAEALERKLGVNLFSVFKDFSQALKENDIKKVNSTLDGFDAAFKQVVSTRAVVGARSNLVKASQDSLELYKVNMTELQSKVEDADTLQVYSDLAKNENVLKASLEVNRKLLTPSLLDFLK